MIETLIRPNILKLKPYVCARNLYTEGIMLDANENSFGSAVISAFADNLNRYPDPESKNLKAAISNFVQARPENIFVGSGSDEIIDLLIRLFVSPGEEIATLDPTYGMYKVSAEINDTIVVSCPLNDEFQINFKEIEKLSGKTKIIFCASPNSPVGNILNEADIDRLCGTFKGIVAVDEAYIEFSSTPSVAGKIKNFENLVVLRTFSKAWGLAGLRIGYAITNPIIVTYLNKIKSPYNLNRISAALAVEALNNAERMFFLRDKITQAKKKLSHELKKIGCEVFPSETNFILIRIQNASQTAKKLAEKGIIVRDFSDKPRLSNCLRITVGTPKENNLLLKFLNP